MKSFTLISLIIFNLLAINMASALGVYGEQTTDSHHVQTHDDTQLSTNIDDPGCEGHSCDHSCHFSAHVVGLISYISLLSTGDTSTLVAISSETFYSLTFNPPLQPPRA